MYVYMYVLCSPTSSVTQVTEDSIRIWSPRFCSVQSND